MPTGIILQGQTGGSQLTGGTGDDTLIGGTGPDVMTGAAGADNFTFQFLPWAAADITDFTHGSDKLDLSGLLAGVHYAGSNPIADGFVKFLDNGQGGTWLYFDSDGKGSADPWGTYVATLDHVAANTFTTVDLIATVSPPPPPPPPPPGTGVVLQGQAGGSHLTGGTGDDTLIGGTGPDVMTGDGGADNFTFQFLPWAAADITDFTHGSDKLDLSGLLAGVHYAGSNPIADGFVKFLDNGQGGTWLYFDTDGKGTADPWGTYVATIDHVAASSFTTADLTTGVSPPPPPPPPPPSPPGGIVQGQLGGSHLVGGAGADTLIGGAGPDVMTGDGGADNFTFQFLPWVAADITDFTHGSDKLDVSGLLSAAHYTGNDPIGDGFVKFLDNGQGGTWLYFDSDGKGSADLWGTFVATLDHVAANTFTNADLITVASPPSPSSFIYGDSAGPLGDATQAGNQVLQSILGVTPIIGIPVGDAPSLADHAQGGADTLTAQSPGAATAFGDANLTISDFARGGNDQVTVGGQGEANAYGDAMTLSGSATGGDDIVQATSAFAAVAIGDAVLVTDNAHGGADHVTGFGGHGTPGDLLGDAETMSAAAIGGDDTITGVTGQPERMVGDALTLTGQAQGGDDLLVGGANTVPNAPQGGVNAMYGDGLQLLDHAHAGNDTLVSGQHSTDLMWGDAAEVGPDAVRGDNLFMFAPQNGQDQIMDFQPGKDRIELDGLGFTDFQQVAGLFQGTPAGVLINFDATDGILIRGVTPDQLSSSDFLLA